MDEYFKHLYAAELQRIDAALNELYDAMESLDSVQDDYSIPAPDWIKTAKEWIEETTIELNAE